MNGNNAFKGIALACAIAVGSACTGVKKTTTDLNPAYSRPSTCAAAIAVYNSRADVPYDYYELAWIEATGNSVWTTDNQLQTQIRNGAAKVGANSATQKATALAIYMPGDAARVRQACGT